MDWKDTLYKAGIVLKESIVEFIERQCREEVDNAKEMQREDDILRAIMGFVDLKASDMMILELLQRHYGIDSISEGKSYITDARSYYRCDKLKECLGLKGTAWVRYKTEHAILDKLKKNYKLLEMSPEKLKVYLEKE